MAPAKPDAKPSTLKLRIISALVLAPPALAAAWFGWPWLPIMVALAAAGCGFEWAKLAHGGARDPTGVIIAVTPFAAAAAMGFGIVTGAFAIAVAGSALALVAAAMMRTGRVLWAGIGTLYIAAACAAFLWNAASGGRPIVLWVLALVWGVDIGAYFAGRAIGGPKLAPSISPNKTWAGFFGGLVAALLVGWAASSLTGAELGWVLLASFVVALAAQAGDLIESWAKRRFDVKDAGNLIPGHGGLLDRLDSLLAASLVLSLLTLVRGAPAL